MTCVVDSSVSVKYDERRERVGVNVFFFFQAEDGIRDDLVTGVQTCALPICGSDPAIYTDHFSLRQRPHFLYCPFLVAAKPLLFILHISCCSSAPVFYTDRQRH